MHRATADTWPGLYQRYYPRYLATLAAALPVAPWAPFEAALARKPAVRTPIGWRDPAEVEARLVRALKKPGPKSEADKALALAILAAGLPEAEVRGRVVDLGELAIRLIKRVPSLVGEGR